MDLMTLVARLTLDSSDYEKKVKKSQSLIGKAGQYIANVAKAYVGIKAVQSVVRFGKEAVEVGKQFDAAMSQVAATMGDKSNEMVNYMGKTMTAQEALRETAKKYGRETQFTATQSAEALNYMALAGYNAEKSIAMLPNVLNLASAGNMELGRASDMVTDASSALGLSTEETTQLIDKMAMASTQGNTSVEQLGEAMLALGATGRNVKGGTTELAQAFTILADNGIKGSEGGTKLRNILLSIQGKKFDKTFGKLGVSAYDASGNLRPMNEILSDMNKVMDGMTTQQKQNLINNTFNRGDLAAVNALLGTSTQRWNDLGVAIDNAGGAAETMAERQLNNLGGDVKKMQSALEGLQIALSEKITPALRFFTQAQTKAFEVFTKILNGNLMETVTNLIPKRFNVAFQLVGNSIRSFVTVFGQLFGTIKEIVETIWGAVTDNVAVNAEEGFGNALGIIEDVLDGITEIMRKVNRWIKENWEQNWRSIMVFILTALQTVRDAVSRVMGIVSGVIQRALTIVNNLWNQYGESIIKYVVNGVQTVWSTVETITNIIIDIVQTAIDTIMNVLEPALEIMFVFWERYGEATVQFVTEKWTMIWEIIQAAVNLISAIIQTFVDAAMWIWNNWGETILAYTDYLFNTMRNTVETVMNLIRDVINLVTALIQGDWSGAWEAIKSIVTDVWNYISTWVENKISFVAETIYGVWEGIKKTTSDVWESIKKTISDCIEGAKEIVHDCVEAIKNFFNFKWELPKLKLPHFSVSGSANPMDWFKQGVPKISVDWYKKAYDNIVEFANPTVIPTLSGLKGFGDGAGSELVMSKDSFFDAIKNAKGDVYQPVFNIYTQKGQSEQEIAKVVDKEFAKLIKQKQAVYR